LSQFYIEKQRYFLPRQARDKHRLGKEEKQGVCFAGDL
jgi:hypothetical protein